jgi:hypothetical protein
LQKFKIENESLLREYVIKNSVYSSPNHELYDDILEMISSYKCKGKTLEIHETFPMNKLVEIMKPYLHLYYKTKFSLDSYQRFYAYELLCKKLVRFINFNPNFGKRYNKLVQSGFNKKKVNTLFHDAHVNFYEDEYSPLYNFENSHLNKETDDDDEDSDADDDDDDSEQNNPMGNNPMGNNAMGNNPMGNNPMGNNAMVNDIIMNSEMDYNVIDNDVIMNNIMENDVIMNNIFYNDENNNHSLNNAFSRLLFCCCS